MPRSISDADFDAVDMQEAALGELLFYDPILSGNQEVACATCHHPAFGISDGLSFGTQRIVDPQNLPEQHIPRNGPALFSLGAHEFMRFFHDCRIEVDVTRPGGKGRF